MKNLYGNRPLLVQLNADPAVACGSSHGRLR